MMMADTADLLDSLPKSNLVAMMETRLYDAIASGQLKPGQRIVEAELARRLDISRAPIREAARRLENRGLLIWEPRRGFFVRRLTPKDILEIYGLRIAVETYAIRLAAQSATFKQLAALDALLERASRLDTGQGVHLFVEVDLEFHRLICRMSGNERLLQAFDDLTSELRLAFSLINRGYQTGERLSARHAVLVEAMRRRDVDAAVAELTRHLEHSCEVVTRAVTADIEASPLRPPAA
jgi:DNA-binding GntR family transcriptional regulator